MPLAPNRSRRRTALATALALGALVGLPHQALADDVVAVAPLATLGTEAKSKEVARIQALLEAQVASVAGVKLIDASTITAATKKAKKNDLRSCDGNTRCLAELGEFVNATRVIYGELGGLGTAQVVYLKIVDPASKSELGSTTLSLGSADDQKRARGAAVRLLDPNGYAGALTINADTEGATIYVDGKRLGKTPSEALSLGVGTHALRITHPEYRDYVRFVDIEFEADTRIEANLQQFPIVASDMRAHGGGALGLKGPLVDGGQTPTPWYRQWYAVAGFGAAVLTVSAIVVGAVTDGIDADRERTVGR